MICIFYVHGAARPPARVGPVNARNMGDARRLAALRLNQDPGAVAIDVWAESGELFRVMPADGEATDAPAPFLIEPGDGARLQGMAE